MKKFLSIVAIFLSLLPLVFFAGCKSKITAEYVKNRTYTVSMATKNVKDNDRAISGNFRIHFFDEHFMVELGESESKDYGFYIGTFEASKDEVKLTITEMSGTFKDGIPSEFNLSLHPLRFESLELKTEYVCSDLVIVKYTFSPEE